MSVTLNPCVSLTSHDDVIINLFPIDMEPPDHVEVQEESRRHRRPPTVVIPEADANGHTFEEVYVYNSTSIQHCTKCDARIAVDAPYMKFKMDPCPKAGTK